MRGVAGKPRVEHEAGMGWIARRANGEEVVPNFVWASRSIARTVCMEADWEDARVADCASNAAQVSK